MTAVKITYSPNTPWYQKRYNVIRSMRNKGVTRKHLRFDICCMDEDGSYMWSEYQKKWVSCYDRVNDRRFGHKVWTDKYGKKHFGYAGGGSSHYSCGHKGQLKFVLTHRQFKRLILEWSKYLPPGIEFAWCGRYNLDAFAKTVALPQYHHLNKRGRYTSEKSNSNSSFSPT